MSLSVNILVLLFVKRTVTVTLKRQMTNFYGNATQDDLVNVTIPVLSKHNCASEMCVNLNIMSFDELLRKFVYRFRYRLGTSLNCIIDNMFSSNVLLYSDIWAW